MTLADGPRVVYTFSMGLLRRSVWLLVGLSGCVEYVPRTTLPELGVPNPRDLEATHQTDTLVQAGVPMVDVLWVVDNSCSMLEEQEGIASNFPVFLQYFQESALDWHIGVVSTDMGDPLHQGKLQSHAGFRWVDNTTPFPEDVLGGMARLGTSGTGRERGRDAVYYALEQHREGANAGFYRGDAGLHVVVISDEHDSSELTTEDEFLSWMDVLKWGDDQLTFSSIVSEDPLCEGAYSVGEEYLRYTDAIGGIFWSICDQDWGTVLRQLGLQAVETSHEYYLSELPVLGTITVTVSDGAASFVFVEDLDWTYNQVRNSITFVEFVPEDGMVVTIDYEVNTGVTSTSDEIDPL